MEGLFAGIVVIATFIIALVALDGAALGFGVDSRPSVGDDHRR